MFFSWLNWSCVFWEEDHRSVIFVTSHGSTCVNMTCPCWCDLDHLVEVAFFRFLLLIILFSFSLFPYCTLWKDVTINSLHIRNRELCSISLRAEYLHKLFGVLLLGRLSTSALWLCKSLSLCGSQQTVENSSRDGNTRPSYLPPEKSVCKSRSNRTEHGTSESFQIGKGVHQGCILSPCLFNLYAEYIMRNAGLDEAQGESRLPGEISITSDMQMTPPLWQKAKNWRASWWKWKRRVKSWLKIQHSKNEDHKKKMKIMTSFPITSWQIDGGNNGNSERLFSWAPKSLLMVTAAMKLKDTCSLGESYEPPRQHIKNQTLLCQQRSV